MVRLKTDVKHGALDKDLKGYNANMTVGPRFYLVILWSYVVSNQGRGNVHCVIMWVAKGIGSYIEMYMVLDGSSNAIQ